MKMQIGPSFDSRRTVRRRCGLSEAAVCRMARCTRQTLGKWEASRGEPGLPPDTVARIADVYAALLYVGGDAAWPDREYLDDPVLEAAVDRMLARWSNR